MVACSAFWLLDQTGLRTLSGVLAIFLSGMTLPLVIFPEPLRSIALALPWASYLQTPADIWLGQRRGLAMVEGLLVQVVWAVVLLALCQVVLRDASVNRVAWIRESLYRHGGQLVDRHAEVLS